MWDSQHKCTADISAEIAWFYHVNMEQNFKGMFSTSCGILAMKNVGCFERKRRPSISIVFLTKCLVSVCLCPKTYTLNNPFIRYLLHIFFHFKVWRVVCSEMLLCIPRMSSLVIRVTVIFLSAWTSLGILLIFFRTTATNWMLVFLAPFSVNSKVISRWGDQIPKPPHLAQTMIPQSKPFRSHFLSIQMLEQ